MKLFPTLALVMVLLVGGIGGARADNSSLTAASDADTSAQGICDSLVDPAQKIRFIAEQVRTTTQDSLEVRACYDTLTEEQKAQVFYQVSKAMGLSDKLDAQAQGIQPLAFGSLLVPWAAAAIGEWRTATMYWVDNGSRCPTDRGTEYNFQYQFSSTVINPGALRANSPTDVGVDSAIAYYTVLYGGLKTWYDTTSTVITTCVGDTALGVVGGPSVWQAHARIIKP